MHFCFHCRFLSFLYTTTLKKKNSWNRKRKTLPQKSVRNKPEQKRKPIKNILDFIATKCIITFSFVFFRILNKIIDGVSLVCKRFLMRIFFFTFFSSIWFSPLWHSHTTRTHFINGWLCFVDDSIWCNSYWTPSRFAKILIGPRVIGQHVVSFI